MLARLKHDEQRGVGLKMGDIVGARGVFPGLPQVLGDLVAGAKRAAIGELLVGRGDAGKEIGGRAGPDLGQVKAGGDVLVEEIGFGKAQIDLLRAQRDNGADTQILAAA